jgi:hypothetical protein
MKLKLSKKKLKNLSKDNKALPMDVTPQVGGGSGLRCNEFRTIGCMTIRCYDTTNYLACHTSPDPSDI